MRGARGGRSVIELAHTIGGSLARWCDPLWSWPVHAACQHASCQLHARGAAVPAASSGWSDWAGSLLSVALGWVGWLPPEEYLIYRRGISACQSEPNYSYPSLLFTSRFVFSPSTESAKKSTRVLC
eukprot:scaffold921_cov37-Tisochrysis_lutea.AAC.3